VGSSKKKAPTSSAGCSCRAQELADQLATVEEAEKGRLQKLIGRGDIRPGDPPAP